MSEPVPQRHALLLQLAAIAGDEPDGALLEVRYRAHQGGMRQRFFPALSFREVADEVQRLGERTDVYVGVAPRREVYRLADRRQSGGVDAIERCWTLWADCDTSQSVRSLACFEPAPAVIVRSGTSDHRHGYWPLRRPLAAHAARRANRRLAHALGADMAATDAARILRPAGTLNHKSDRAPVVCERLELVTYTPREVVADLPDPPGAPPPARCTRRARSLDSTDPLRRIPAVEYVPALTGRHPDRDGKIACPFHAGGEERTPSLHVYPDDCGWACFGCGRGGSIIDLGALLYSLEPRGDGFREIRRHLAADLLTRLHGAAA